MPYPTRRWHSSSEFGTGPRKSLKKEDKRAWYTRVRSARLAGQISAAQADVADALADFLGPDGACYPSHAALATRSGCSDRTVRRALAVLRELGLVRWVRRLVRAGWRTEQTSNAYVLDLPEAPAASPARLVEQGKKILRDLPDAMSVAGNPVLVAAAQAALVAIAGRRSATFRAVWAARIV